MNESRALSIPLAMDCKILEAMKPEIEERRFEMSRVPFSNIGVVLKRVFRYMNGSRNLGIVFNKKIELARDSLMRFVDSDYHANVDNKRSQFGFCFTFHGSVVS